MRALGHLNKCRHLTTSTWDVQSFILVSLLSGTKMFMLLIYDSLQNTWYPPPISSFHCSSTKCKVWWILLNIKSTEWFSAFHYIFSFPLWFITGYWIWFFILYTKTLLFIHPIYNSLHLLIPNSQTIPSPARLLPWQSQPLK